MMKVNWTDEYGKPALNIAGFYPYATCMGPGKRCVIWVQGCLQRCPGCITPNMQPLIKKKIIAVQKLVEVIEALSGLEGITVVGGEPILQADLLSDVFKWVKTRLGLGIMVYTGYHYRMLLKEKDPAVRKLLEHTDLLVDGPYVQDLDYSQKWRGSENQHFHFLTDRYQSWEVTYSTNQREIEIHLDAEGRYLILGIPPKHFNEEYLESMPQKKVGS